MLQRASKLRLSVLRVVKQLCSVPSKIGYLFSDPACLPEFLFALGNPLQLLGKFNSLAKLVVERVHQVGRLLLIPVHADHLLLEVTAYEQFLPTGHTDEAPGGILRFIFPSSRRGAELAFPVVLSEDSTEELELVRAW
jgi:hypothetical protein